MSPTAFLGAFNPVKDPLEQRRQKALLTTAEATATEAQQKIADEKAVRTAVGTGPFNEDTIHKVYAANPRAGAALAKVYYDGLKSQHDAKEADLKAQKEQLALGTQKSQAISNGLGSIKAPDQRPLAIEGMVQQGLISAEEGQQLSSMPDAQFETVRQQKISEGLGIVKEAELASKALEDQHKQLTEDRAAAAEKQAVLLRPLQAKEAENKALNSTPDPVTGLTKEQQAQLDAKNQTVNEANLALTASKGKQPGATPLQVKEGRVAEDALRRMTADKIASRPITQFVAPQGVPEVVTIDKVPEEIRGKVQRIINGDEVIPPSGRNNPSNQATSYWVGKVDPGYTASRADLKKSLVSGKDAESIKSLNTAINHLGALADNSEKLDNTIFRKYNNFGNWLSREAGSDKTARFRTDRIGVSSELSTLLKGGVASKAEVDHWLDAIDSADSPGTLRSTVSEIGHLVAGRIEAIDNKQAQLPEAGRVKLLTDRSKQVLQKLSSGTSSEKLPPEAKSKLKAGHETTFGNGQVWALDSNGQEKRVR